MGDATHSGLAVDFGRLMEAQDALSAAARALDREGAGAPDGDYGDAAVLVAWALAASAEAAASLVTEAVALGEAVDMASTDVAVTDLREALDFYRLGDCA